MAFTLRGRLRSEKTPRGARRKPRRLVLEALEDRLVLSFAAPVYYNVGTQNSLESNGFGPHVITGDFHGTGKLDLAVTNTVDGTVSILASNGNGTFQPAVTYSTGLGSNGPVWLAAADFNGDGKLDLAIEGGNSVSVLLNNGNGTFGAPKVYATGTGVRGGVAVADFFGNGRQDIAVVAFSTNNVQILPNNGNGTFGTPVIVAMPSTFHNIRSIDTGNIFGNGHADLVIAGNEGYNNTLQASDPAGVAVFKNDGTGHFTFVTEYLAVITPDPGGAGTGDIVNPEQVNLADLNGDGKLDIVLSLYDHNIDVYINNGDGTFKTGVGYTTETAGGVGGYPRGVAFADVNHDGKIDIITDNTGQPNSANPSASEPGSVGILYGNGDGTFQSPVIQYTPYLLPSGLVVGDFNNDGWADLAVAQNYTGHSVAVMLNQPNTATEPPTVTGVSPVSGPVAGGTVVTIAGTNFTGTSQVDFGSVPAKFTVNSDTSITATAPPQSVPGLVDVSVYNAGASATSSADHFTYLSSQPTVTGVSPNVGPTYGGNTVTIAGLNFTGATAVKFGNLNATFTVNSATSITATAPAEAPGLVDVTVITPAGTSSTSSLDKYTYQTPVLTTVTVTPTTATLADGASQAFAATGLDQFGKPLVPQPTFAWSLSGLGSVTSAGVYTAPATGSGTTYVIAKSGTIYNAAKVTYSAVLNEVWTGLGTTNNWSDPANWSGKVVPTAASTVTFNATSSKNAVVDRGFAGTVASVQITSVYGGTISLSRSLFVTGTFTEASGVYNANGFTTNVVGLSLVYGGTYVAGTGTQTLGGGLGVLGGTFNGSTGTVTVGMFGLTSGTMNAPSGNLYVTGGKFTYVGGTFNADGGTVTYTGVNASPTLSLGTGGIAFANFTDALFDTYPAGMTITGTLTVNGTFSWKTGASFINGTIEARGDVDDEDHGGIGNPLLTLDGSANQTIEDLTGVGGGQFRTITINKAGGSVSLACNPYVFTGLYLTAGIVGNTGPFAWYVTGPISTAAGWNLGNIVVAGSNVTVVGSSVQVANLTFLASSDKLTAPTGNLLVSGDWNDSVAGALVANGGTVVFDGTFGTQQWTSGGQSFNNVTIAAGSAVQLEADVIIAGNFTILGTFDLNGHKVVK